MFVGLVVMLTAFTWHPPQQSNVWIWLMTIHMHQFFYALSRSKSRGPFQISKLCICVHACYEGPASTFMNIYIYTFPYTIFAAPQSCLFFTSSPLSIHIKRSIHFFSKMGFTSRKLVLLVVLFNFMLLSAWSFRELEAMRLLGGGQWAKRNSLVLQSLQKGPVLPSGPSPCTHIPEQRAGRCTFNEKNIAYDIATAPPAVSAYMLAEDAAMASLAKDGYDQDHSF